MDEKTLILTAVAAAVLGVNRILGKDLPRFRSLPTWGRALVSGVLGLVYAAIEAALQSDPATLKAAVLHVLVVSGPSLLINAVELWAGGVPPGPGDGGMARRASMRGLALLGIVIAGNSNMGCTWLGSQDARNAFDEVSRYLNDAQEALSLILSIKSAIDAATKQQILPADVSAKLDRYESDAAMALDAVQRAAKAGKALSSYDYSAAILDFGKAWDGLMGAIKDSGLKIPAIDSTGLTAFRPSGAAVQVRPMLLTRGPR